MTVTVALKKKLRSDHTLRIDDERPRVRDTLGLTFRSGVEDVIVLNDLAFRIGEQEKADLRLVGEFL